MDPYLTFFNGKSSSDSQSCSVKCCGESSNCDSSGEGHLTLQYSRALWVGRCNTGIAKCGFLVHHFA